MNNENNELNNVKPELNSVEIPNETEFATAEMPKLVEAPETLEQNMAISQNTLPEIKEEAPVVEPVLNVAENVVPVTPEPAASITPEVEKPITVESNLATGLVDSTPVEPVTPIIENQVVNNVPLQDQTSKKDSNLAIIILIVAVLLTGLGLGAFFIVKGLNKDNKPKPVINTYAVEFLTLANKYVNAVKELWSNDTMLCQNAANQSELLKPSQLSSVDAYSGPAYYYVFINTKDASEMKLNVNDKAAVAGWVRIGKSDNSFYVALSDGKNYIVDKGTEFGVVYSALTPNDVITTGNGANYQYMNGEIFGSNTEGNGWGIGDVLLLTDGDDTNDGIYMSNGKKTSGWTPFCSNITE